MPIPIATNGATCANRRLLMGIFFNHRIKSNAAGSVQAVVLAKSARG
jgi:hypothetical protein